MAKTPLLLLPPPFWGKANLVALGLPAWTPPAARDSGAKTAHLPKLTPLWCCLFLPQLHTGYGGGCCSWRGLSSAPPGAPPLPTCATDATAAWEGPAGPGTQQTGKRCPLAQGTRGRRDRLATPRWGKTTGNIGKSGQCQPASPRLSGQKVPSTANLDSSKKFLPGPPADRPAHLRLDIPSTVMESSSLNPPKSPFKGIQARFHHRLSHQTQRAKDLVRFASPAAAGCDSGRDAMAAEKPET